MQATWPAIKLDAGKYCDHSNHSWVMWLLDPFDPCVWCVWCVRDRSLFKQIRRYFGEPGGFVGRHSCYELWKFSEHGDWSTNCLSRSYSPKVEYAGFVSEGSISCVMCWLLRKFVGSVVKHVSPSQKCSMLRVGRVCSRLVLWVVMDRGIGPDSGRTPTTIRRTQIHLDLSYIDPQARVLNSCFKS